MGKVVVSEFVSVDGVFEDPGGTEGYEHGSWTFEYDRGDEGNQFKLDELMQAEVHLLGRVTYEGFAAYWPHQTGDMADTMNGTTKYVVSGTLTSADWQNSTLIPAAAAFAKIAELKQQQGQNIGITGSGTLVSSLLREGLLDELHLFIFPVVLGSGTRLFAMPGDKLPLRLIDSATFETGVVHLTYAKA